MIWPFQKKKQQGDNSQQMAVLCIPGFWDDNLGIFHGTEGEIVAAGPVLLNMKKNKHCIFEIHEHDPQMRQSFKYAGKSTQISDLFLDEIQKHTSVIYISIEIGKADDLIFLAETAT